MTRRKKLAVKSMHPMDLYSQAMDGCDVCLTELIDRQQDRRALRLYPNGRDGVLDDGVIPIQLKVTNSAVVGRSGQPWLSIEMNCHCLSVWIIGMSECMEWLIKNASSDQSISPEETVERINRVATKDFDVEISSSDKTARVKFLPADLRKWKIPVWGAIKFVKESLDVVDRLGWKIKGTKGQLGTVEKFADADCGDIWDITTTE